MFSFFTKLKPSLFLEGRGGGVNLPFKSYPKSAKRSKTCVRANVSSVKVDASRWQIQTFYFRPIQGFSFFTKLKLVAINTAFLIFLFSTDTFLVIDIGWGKNCEFCLSVLVEDIHFVNGLRVFSYILFIFSVLFRYAPKEQKENMDDTHRASLRNKLRPTLRNDVEPRNLLQYLRDVFNETDEEEIKAEKTRTDQVDKMLEILTRRGPNAFDEFVSALFKTQPHLGCALIQETGKKINE